MPAMLSGVCASVKKRISNWFNKGLGVKQGDPSGPRAFVTFIHDLPESICPDDPSTREYAVFLANQFIKCLLWADDLLLFSRSIGGVQKQLDALYKYCEINQLCVNRKKTQVLYINTRINSLDIMNEHVFTYGGTPLINVASYKYVGTWLNNNGSCDLQAKEVIAKASRAMYQCMSKCRRISSNCPSSLRVVLFKSYVLPLFTYCCEVIPYTFDHIHKMNNIIVKYARWATGLPSYTCNNAVLREAGLRPIYYDFLQARMNYYLLIKSRQDTHVTQFALLDMTNRSSTSAYYKWYRGVLGSFDKLSCTELIENPHAFKSNKSVIKVLVKHLWLHEGGATMEQIDLSSN